eukprot:CAMPEP_0185833542 /NCGR_PEP_ID=MMETSP1353-20130828/3030_1 /TAXON_ID=1077150 /ORGANISM="Erythrolobus australicus, Strain CCMP3124" /LENGTH=93 /DNA_ID=CAMNT_0028531849 /DNA_START=235 /DNA_END=513 /DNA_ORIENTATION=-
MLFFAALRQTDPKLTLMQACNTTDCSSARRISQAHRRACAKPAPSAVPRAPRIRDSSPPTAHIVARKASRPSDRAGHVASRRAAAPPSHASSE